MRFSPPTRLRRLLFQSLRLCFRAMPLSEARRDSWRNAFLARFPRLVPSPPQALARHALHCRQARRQAGTAAIGHVPHRHAPLPTPLPATLVAFYLPQFHPIPENDAWWGEGFTEWRNVARALPQFEGHAQPRLPADLGFYDLRTPGVMAQQAQLAREYGIGAFCFYFYWFGGKTLLETPLRQWRDDPTLDMPLCLCWANENWARNWDGRSGDVLIAQQHSPDDDLAFIDHIADYLRDPRYLRVDGKPLLLVYRPGLLPDARATAQRWRARCHEQGIGDIHLAYVQGFERPDPGDIGFDAAVEFPPNLSTATSIAACQRRLNPGYAGEVLDWRALARPYARRPLPDYPLYPGVNPGWDNEPRRAGRGRTYLHASPRGYRDWLRDTIRERLAQAPASRRLVFINAWNEWAEGAVLEPDARLGHAWLDATRQALAQAAAPVARPQPIRPCAVIHAWYLDVFDELLAALVDSGIEWRLVVTAPVQHATALRRVLSDCPFPWELEVHENRGRDILPFLHVANRLLDEGVDLVLKLHTKRSPHVANGEQWRQELCQSLTMPERTARLLAAMQDETSLGLIVPDHHLLSLHDFIGGNRDTLEYLAVRAGLPIPSMDTATFVSGSMFWARLEALRPLLDAHLDCWEFEDEAGQVDGTFAHAVERSFGLAVQAAGYRVVTAAAVVGEPESDGPAHYPYARRS